MVRGDRSGHLSGYCNLGSMSSNCAWQLSLLFKNFLELLNSLIPDSNSLIMSLLNESCKHLPFISFICLLIFCSYFWYLAVTAFFVTLFQMSKPLLLFLFIFLACVLDSVLVLCMKQLSFLSGEYQLIIIFILLWNIFLH